MGSQVPLIHNWTATGSSAPGLREAKGRSREVRASTLCTSVFSLPHIWACGSLILKYWGLGLLEAYCEYF